jgi:arylsulfatase
MIYADDLGWGDLGCYGSPIATPNLDRIATEGVRFTNFYSANPVCSPSRAALMTGRYPTRVGVPRVLFPNDRSGLAAGETTIAQMLKPSGYRTMCVGKWHLGHHPEHLPASWGFDSYFGIPYSNDMNPPVLVRQADGKAETVAERAAMDSITQQYTAEAVRFVESSRDTPFFLYMPHTMVHIPLGASARFRGKSAQGLYGDAVQELDWSVGEVASAVKRIGQDRNTLVMFSSDNGPWFQGSPGRLRGRKGSTHEGGVRVPLVARMPGRVAKGRVVSGIGSTMDVLPTVSALTGAKLPGRPLDGINILPMLEGSAPSLDREALLYFDGWNLQCARWKQWKLHVARYNSMVYSPPPAGGRVNLPLTPPELYDLTSDVDESFDVSAMHPGVVKEIEDRINRLLGGFPDEVRSAWSETRRRPTGPSEPGRLPRSNSGA